MVTTIIILNTGFNVNYWNRCSLEYFLKETIKSGFFKEYDPDKRLHILKTAYRLICEA
jgi:hypothetical protein